MLPAVTAPPPFVALGYLSGGANGPRRTQIRQVAAKFAGGGVAYRFVLGMPESVREVRPRPANYCGPWHCSRP